MLEKRFIAVPPQAFTADGAANGIITVENTTLFKVKQEIILQASTLPNIELEVKQIYSINQMRVGPRAKPIQESADVSAYTVALGASIFSNEQSRPKIPFEEHTRAVYEEEPVVATRVIGVDKLGNTVNWSEDGLVPQEYDEVVLTRDLCEDIIEAQFYLRGVEIRDLEFTYNLAKSLVRVRKVGP